MRIFGFNVSRAVKSVSNSAKGGGRYHVVSSDVDLRERGIRELGEEFDILGRDKRGKMLDMARNQVRNSPTFNAILKQFDLNAVGTVGGKCTFSVGTENENSAIREAFARWARSCEYFDGMRLGDMLKVILKTYLVGGECVLLFDDGLVEDSGKVVLFEPDEMVNLSASDFGRMFPKGWSQVDGHILNEFGRSVGVILSRSGRGLDSVPAANAFKLVLNAGEDQDDAKWLNPRNVWRKRQVVGVSPAASVLANTIDLEDLAKYELQAAKKNSQTIAQVIQDRQDEEAPSAFDSGTDFSAMTDAEVRDAADAEASAARTVSLDRIKGAGCLYEVMPEGTKLDLLDTKHPNQNMPNFIEWLAGRSAAPFGLSKMFATMKVEQSFSACQGEMNMSWPAFEEAQKFLEHICDWIVSRWVAWSDRRGTLPVGSDMLSDISRRVSWEWPRQRAVNAVDEQTAIEKRLRNCTGSYRQIYGADWQTRLNEISEEIEFCKANGIPHPALTTVSGSVVDMDGEGGMEAK